MRVLFATEGSDCSRLALEEALRILPHDAQFFVISVAGNGALGGTALDWGLPGNVAQQVEDDLLANAHQACEDAREVLARAGLRAVAIERRGHPTEEILGAAREIDADLIVMGCHGRSRVGRLVWGSISDAVLHRWPRAAMIIRHPQGALPHTRPLPVQVAALMTPAPIGLRADATLQDVARRMREGDTGFIPLLEGERIVGVITDRDVVVRAIAEGADPARTPARPFASSDLVSIAPEASLKDAIVRMAERRVRRLLVMEGPRLVGVLSLGDLAEWAPVSAETVLQEVSKSERTLSHLAIERAS